MNSTTASNPTPTALNGHADGYSSDVPQDLPAAARTVVRLLQRLQHGSLTMQWPQGQLQHFGVSGGVAQPEALQRMALLAGGEEYELLLSAPVLQRAAMGARAAA